MHPSEFTIKWVTYPALGRLSRDNCERVIPFFAFPAEVRRITYTTNAVESLHGSLRKTVKTRGSFPSEEAALKLLYLSVRNTIAKWQTVQFWKEALNCFHMLWGERIEAALASRLHQTRSETHQQDGACSSRRTRPTRQPGRECQNGTHVARVRCAALTRALACTLRAVLAR